MRIETTIQPNYEFTWELAKNIIVEWEKARMSIKLTQENMARIDGEKAFLRALYLRAYKLCYFYNDNPPCTQCIIGCVVDTVKLTILEQINALEQIK